MTTTDLIPRLTIGLEVTGAVLDAKNPSAPHSEFANDASVGLRTIQPDGYEFLTTNIPTTGHTRPDIINLEGRWWGSSVVGVIANIADIPRNLEWAGHMDLPAVLMPPVLTSTTMSVGEIAAYASVLTPHLADLREQKLLVPVTVSNAEAFRLFHQLLHFHSAIQVLLVLEPQPKQFDSSSSKEKYVAEALRKLHLLIGNTVITALGLTSATFVPNKRGYPTLPKALQYQMSLVLSRIGRKLKVLVQPSTSSAWSSNNNNNTLPNEALGGSGCLPLYQYIQHLRGKEEITSILDTDIAKMETEYGDFLDQLQQPLQPLADHLQFQTYEVFETDPVKYRNYEEAILGAMQDHLSSSMDASHSDPFLVLVVGAGRGPLVDACLRAYQRTLQTFPCHLYAIEKNPSAVLFLQSKSISEWNQEPVQIPVKVVRSDLRNLSATELFGEETIRADLVVSELLGSFGCNELSPECLDGLYATNVCDSDTISIPTRYTSFAAPVASMQLYQNACQQSQYPNPSVSTTSVIGFTKAMETPYVVRAHSASQICPAKECWSFSHPNLDKSSISGDQSVNLTFTPDASHGVACGCGYGRMDRGMDVWFQQSGLAPLPWTCTGILGTFSAELYAKNGTENNEMMRISTEPGTFSVGMFSWFPLYFPLTTPLRVPAGAAIQIQIWRKCDSNRVWYEWAVQVIQNECVLSASPIHNPGGRSYYVSKL